ncbi:MAG TPA: S53 family peptidase [Caulobacteraceae bacterium]|nr:S53 family peptidase [Caulobacteraceae bacterium]
MIRFATTAVLAAAIAMAAASTASAQVQVSGKVFHVRACGPTGPGVARCHAHIVSDSRGAALLNRFMANLTERNARTQLVPQGYGPSDLHAAYAITTNGSAATTIAIVDAYGYTNAESDLATYRSTYGLPACTTANGCFGKYNENGQKGSYPSQNTGWAQETALDLDMASAMCPNCKIILVEANSATYNDLAAAENRAAALGAHVISNSYGGGENGSQSFEAAYNHPGVAITASTGDSGYGAGPQFPATSPHVIAVGGTSLVRASNARGWSETAWADAGSGCSKVYAKPSWQTDPLCTTRMEADVSAVADPYTGVAVYGPANARSSAWLVFGGTSVAAPLVGGIYANNGGAVTYGANPYTHGASLNDVTSGANGSCGGTYFCTAGAGYDGPTGLGTPKGGSAF